MRDDDEDDEEEDWEEEQGLEEGSDEQALTTEGRLVQLRVHNARNVPQVDTFSESDPFVVVKVPGAGKKPPRTVTIQDEPNPVWEEDFYFECEAYVSDGTLQGVIELEVWDEDMVTDSVIGRTTLDLGKFHPMDWALIELPLVLVDKAKAKYEKQMQQKQKRGLFGRKLQQGPDQGADMAPVLVVSIVGSIPSFSTLAQHVADIPDTVVDERAQMVLTPVQGFPVLVGIQYGTNPRKGPRHVVLSTQEWDGSGTRLRVDFEIPGDACLPDAPEEGAQGSGREADSRGGGGGGGGDGDGGNRPRKSHESNNSHRPISSSSSSEPQLLATIERLQWPKGRKLTPTVRVFEETSLNNLPLSVDLYDIQLLLASKLPVVAYDAATLLSGAGWQGPGVSFKLALSAMSEYMSGCSKSAQEVYVAPDDELPPACVMALDFKDMEQTPLGPTPHITAYPNRTSGLHWELSGEGEASTRVQEQVYTHSLRVMRGEAKFRTRRRLRLVDPNGELSCQETLGGLHLVGFELDHARQVELPLLDALYGHTAVDGEPSPRKFSNRGLSKMTESLKDSIQGGLEGLKELGSSSLKGLGSLLKFGKKHKEGSSPKLGESGSGREWQEDVKEPHRRSRLQQRPSIEEVELEEDDEEEDEAHEVRPAASGRAASSRHSRFRT